ncbi:hypothetical protein MKX67_13805 [Cytobacillus sp. FSL W7-1323]|uniref:hypothetical protein n=1 Tax=Cytobacillus TaxID=2675230 RepID=UPI002AFFEBF5|nr:MULTISPECIES: hypothetical protein [Cytobacillus]MEA1852709.1 hypothetical protein [Cytobacillus sp. OWB-43]MED1604419.1 hypothetical protein [Cytobacillus kochii]
MNIQQYYQQSAQASLNGSLVACIPLWILVIYHSFFQEISGLLWWCLPFVLYSGMSYQSYVLANNQAKISSYASTNSKQKNIFSQREFLIGFLPAPNLRLLLFNRDGRTAAEIRDLAFHKWRWFLPTFVDRWIYRNRYALVVDQRVLAIITVRKHNIQIDYNSNTILLHNDNNKRFICQKDSRAYTLRYERTFMNLLVQSENGRELGKLQKGWIPREWMESFKVNNTPFLMMNQPLPADEQLIFYSLLIMYVKNIQH